MRTERWRRLLTENRNEIAMWVLAMALAAFMLAPVLSSGFFSDDGVNSLVVPAAVAAQHSSLLREVANAYGGAVKAIGRFFPFATYAVFLFWFVNGNLALYKWLILLLVLADLALFGRLVRALTASPAMGVLAIILPPLLFQFRFYSDPILAFGALPQVITLLTFGSLLAWVAFLRDGDKRDLVVSLVLYGMSLLTYEIVLPFFVLHLLIAWWYPRRRPMVEAVKASWPFAALAVGSAAVAVGVRLANGIALAGGATGSVYTPNTDPFAALFAMARQVSAALPLSYHILLTTTTGIDGVRPFEGLFAYIGRYPASSLFILAGVTAFVAAAVWMLRSPAPAPATKKRTAVPAAPSSISIPGLLWTGAGLLVLPATLIALSPKYQSEILWGKGYIPVYVSYFGTALLIIAGLRAAARIGSAKKPLRAVLAVGLALTLGALGVMTYQDNRIIVERFDRDWLYPRQVEQDALARGLVSPVPAGSQVVMLVKRGWDEPAFFAIHAGKLERTADAREAATWTAMLTGRTPQSVDATATRYVFGAKDDVWIANADGLSAYNGYAIVGRLAAVTVSGGKPVQAEVDTVRVYLSSPQPPVASPVLVGGTAYDPPQFTSPQVIGLNPATLQRLAGGDGWSLSAAPPGQVLNLRL